MRARSTGSLSERSRWPLVQLGQGGQLALLEAEFGHPRPDVAERLGAGDNQRPLMAARQEVRRPHLAARVGRVRGQDQERRQIAVERAQPVADPGTDARPGKVERAGVHAQGGVVMVGVVAVHRADDADVVHAAGDVGKQLADLGAALAVRLEAPLRFLEEQLLVAGPVARFRMIQGHLLAVVGMQAGFGVEGIDVRHAAAQEEEDHALCLAGEVRWPRCQRIKRVGCGCVSRQQLAQHAGQQRRGGKGGAEKSPAGWVAAWFKHRLSQSTKRNSLLLSSTRT